VGYVRRLLWCSVRVQTNRTFSAIIGHEQGQWKHCQIPDGRQSYRDLRVDERAVWIWAFDRNTDIYHLGPEIVWPIELLCHLLACMSAQLIPLSRTNVLPSRTMCPVSNFHADLVLYSGIRVVKKVISLSRRVSR
jgi:hypothetical protein